MGEAGGAAAPWQASAAELGWQFVSFELPPELQSAGASRSCATITPVVGCVGSSRHSYAYILVQRLSCPILCKPEGDEKIASWLSCQTATVRLASQL